MRGLFQGTKQYIISSQKKVEKMQPSKTKSCPSGQQKGKPDRSFQVMNFHRQHDLRVSFKGNPIRFRGSRDQ